ncbi:MAG: cytochrome c oxidase subunit 3 [Fibrella sp.]|nr:cytochrome c oxidase subunit 3 [Armatimonadota bacterium]
MSLRAAIAGTAPSKGGAHGGIIDQPVAHQFEDIDQQNECYMVGMWTFLVTEIMFFGALFLAYSVYRTLYPATYLDCHRFLDIKWGTINTGVLLFSSWSMVMAVVANQHGKKWPMIFWLSVVIACSLGFLGIKAIEYSSKIKEGLWVGNFDYAKANTEWIHHHEKHGSNDANRGNNDAENVAEGHSPDSTAGIEAAIPGAQVNASPGKLFEHEAKLVYSYYPSVRELAAGYRYTNPTYSTVEKAETGPFTSYQGGPSFVETASKRAQLFFSIYFGMTGLHAIHIIIGILMMGTIIGLRFFDHPSVTLDYMPTEMVGLYWHFVDIVWIFLFPLMYLIS